ncbi:coiled-coil domain-containing protein 152 isoform X1 [Neopsephotus bourkii]|uniref:coiled-coil domain-containing protein 152 isoform X1 n=1 Tax=Neopsephotus bourkii TaxID=309878 RepID=UPI002AA55B07|nr:coiled-coil domain-containing protein 152 isoform X1 [Neopsephotus bourkii]XP_061208180.1 coiled-coil domain-containing protein 152 isoform X1 [Neopsephotus bourkii]
MSHRLEEPMKRTSVVNLDKLLDNISEIEKKITEVNDVNNLLVFKLEKCNRLLTLSQSKEESVREECATLQNVVKGLTQTIEKLCNVKDENDRLKGTIHILEEKLKTCEQEYKGQIEKLMKEIKTKEEDHKSEVMKLNCDMMKKIEAKEREYKEEREKKDLETQEITRQLRIQNEEKQKEIIKLQIEFNAKLATVQGRKRSFWESSAFPQSIYRRKLQNFQEEKNQELERLRNTIKELEKRLLKEQEQHFKQRQF